MQLDRRQFIAAAAVGILALGSDGASTGRQCARGAYAGLKTTFYPDGTVRWTETHLLVGSAAHLRRLTLQLIDLVGQVNAAPFRYFDETEVMLESVARKGSMLRVEFAARPSTSYALGDQVIPISAWDVAWVQWGDDGGLAALHVSRVGRASFRCLELLT